MSSGQVAPSALASLGKLPLSSPEGASGFFGIRPYAGARLPRPRTLVGPGGDQAACPPQSQRQGPEVTAWGKGRECKGESSKDGRRVSKPCENAITSLSFCRG